MNSIMNRGFVGPYIIFEFANGTIDTIPPKYFARFHQNRSVSHACSFTLELSYAPGNFNEQTTTVIHNLLLSSVKQPVHYRYGYKTPGGGMTLQNQYYTGIFTEYEETLGEGFLTYTISGIARQLDIANIPITMEGYMSYIHSIYGLEQPSNLVEDLLTTTTSTDINKMFQGYDIYIDHTDDAINRQDINIESGSLHDIFFGKSNQDGTILPNGFVHLSHRKYTPDFWLQQGLLSESDVSFLRNYEWANRYASSTVSQEIHQKYNSFKNLLTMPFVCYFDNVVPSLGSPQKGSFFYKEKFNRQATDIFTYNFGNNILNSDVISFDANYNYVVAMGTVSALQGVSNNIDANGQNVGGTYVVSQTDGFKKNTFSTLSGFNESAFLSASTIAEHLTLPLEASMTVVGQIDCNQLMDCIKVNVFVNGVQHVPLTGTYAITEIEDDLSESGFTTTFKLLRAEWNSSDSMEAPNFISNSSTSRAWHNQDSINSSR